MNRSGLKIITSETLKNNSGFTLIELLIVMVIISLISAVSYTALTRFNRTQNLNVGYENMKNDISYAKSIALSQVVKNCKGFTSGPSPIQMVFEGYSFHYKASTEEYWIEEECNPDLDEVTRLVNKKNKLPSNVDLINDGGNDEKSILFNPLGGGTSLSANRTITLESSDDRSMTITVYPSGGIE